LDPGEYTFNVKGANGDGVWNEKGRSIGIIISPPWWQTNWAYIGYGALFFFSIFAVNGFFVSYVIADLLFDFIKKAAAHNAPSPRIPIKIYFTILFISI